MRKCKLKDLIEVSRGATLPGRFYSTEGDLIRLTLGNFDYNNGGFKQNTSKEDIYYTGDVRPEFILNKGDIITPLTEQAVGLLGTTAKIPESGKYIQSQDVALVKCLEGLYPGYCYYLLPSNTVKKQLSVGAQQTSIRHTSPDKIKDCWVYILEKDEQKKVADFLDMFERKIAINRRINERLEGMAKLLYDYWFVQFDFPNEEGKPYKSSGGKMVWNEKLKREIPEGWEYIPINAIADVFNGSTPATSNKTYYDGDIVWITPKDLSIQQEKFIYYGERYITQDGYNSCSTHKLPVNTVLMTSRAPIGLLSISKTELCTNQGFKSLVPKILYLHIYLYYYLKQHINQIMQLGSGTTFKEVSRNEMLQYQIILPPKQVLKQFEDKCSQINDRQLIIQKENNNLTNLRDFLLPMLMNGQVEIKEK